jgi:hypothetical protein
MLIVLVVFAAAVQALIFAGASLWLVMAALRARGNAPQTADWPLKNLLSRCRSQVEIPIRWAVSCRRGAVNDNGASLRTHSASGPPC